MVEWWEVELFTGDVRRFQAKNISEAREIVNIYGGGSFHLVSGETDEK